MMKIGLQVYSIRDDAANDFAAAMKKVKDMGYDGVELAGTYGLSAAEIKKVLADVGLEVISAHIPLDDMEKDPDGTPSAYKWIGFDAALVGKCDMYVFAKWNDATYFVEF
jgi:sugar phosphate isomerase/epimerase